MSRKERISKKAEALKDTGLCSHCLGRQFAQLGHGLENYERAWIIRNSEELDEDSFDPERVPGLEPGGECRICGGVFKELERYTEMVKHSLERYELSTFLIGIRPPEEVVQAEEELWEEYGVEFTEPVKTELSRLLGKRVEEDLRITVEFERPDIMAVVDMRDGKERVELQVNSLLIYGQYNKYSREIPQTEWHCRNCRGSGCDECDWTGKQYPTSVQEIIQEPFKRDTRAIEAKFHGGGREDVDARCLGKREFVLELVEPLQRNLDLEELAEEVNSSQENVEIFNVRPAEKQEIAEIKQKHADKRYRAIVELGERIEGEDLEVLEELVGTVKQFTPERVQHRRAEKVREREVYDVKYSMEEGKLVLEVEAEAGTYIKELISSDGGNTEPSVAGLLGCGAECVQLDVLWVEK